MYSGKCPKCSRSGTVTNRGRKEWTARQPHPDGGNHEVVIAIDYYWRCDACGESFTEHQAMNQAEKRDGKTEPAQARV